jgi:hypothetical protein
MGIAETISNGFRAVAEYFGWAKQREVDKNAAPISKAAAAAKAQGQEDEITKHVKDGNVDEVRKDIAE